eukprot:2085424-Amphidinium_carterae.1
MPAACLAFNKQFQRTVRSFPTALQVSHVVQLERCRVTQYDGIKLIKERIPPCNALVMHRSSNNVVDVDVASEVVEFPPLRANYNNVLPHT